MNVNAIECRRCTHSLRMHGTVPGEPDGCDEHDDRGYQCPCKGFKFHHNDIASLFRAVQLLLEKSQETKA